jgi:hypothetical protein
MNINDIDKFQGCMAMNCARLMNGKKKIYANYLIEDSCRHAIKDRCPYGRSKVEVQRSQPET